VQPKSPESQRIVIQFPNTKTVSCEGRNFEIRFGGLTEDPAWDDFVLARPDAHHEQTSPWGRARATIGWTVLRVVMTEDSEIVGGAQVQLRSIARMARWAYITFGPYFAREDPVVERVLMAEIKNILRQQRVLYLLAQLPYDAHRLGERLQANGFIRPPRAIAPFYIRATLVLDLTKTEEKLLAEMHATTRNRVRQGMKRGITVVQGGAADLDTLWELMRALCARRKTTPNPPSPDFFHQIWNQFSARGWINLFLANYQGRPVAAALAFPFGDWFRVWKVGWSGEHAELRPNKLLWWELIRHARNRGIRHFDFVNVELAQPAILHPASPPVPASDGETMYKIHYGGTIKVLPGAYCYFLSPIARVGLRVGMARLLNSETCIRLARKAWRRR
jgi:lipid II:glycine glycyltransferase (peptidoglycan interpeptide bridge formation enzyme)